MQIAEKNLHNCREKLFEIFFNFKKEIKTKLCIMM